LKHVTVCVVRFALFDTVFIYVFCVHFSRVTMTSGCFVLAQKVSKN